MLALWPGGGRGNGRRGLALAPAEPTGLPVCVMALVLPVRRSTPGGGSKSVPRRRHCHAEAQAGDFGRRGAERDPHRSGSFALDRRGSSQGVGAAARARGILRLMRENGLLSPHRHLPRSEAAHDGRITTHSRPRFLAPLFELLASLYARAWRPRRLPTKHRTRCASA